MTPSTETRSIISPITAPAAVRRPSPDERMRQPSLE